ncbi:MAG: flavodoxin family protein [Syntrophorhabdales bacterium]|jgi:multimeric flavodoxin WrbA
MKVVVFNGSPRTGGNVETLLWEMLRPVEYAGHDVVKFNLNEMNIKPCQDCGGCEETGDCVIKDDMVQVSEAIRAADRLVLGSPIFFFGLSAQAKTMIDRCQSFWCEKYVLKRPIPGGPEGRKGLLILVGGMKKEVGIACSGETAKAFFRTVSVPQHETVSFLGIDRKGAICGHETALDDVYRAGRRLVGLEGG